MVNGIGQIVSFIEELPGCVFLIINEFVELIFSVVNNFFSPVIPVPDLLVRY